MTLVSHRVLTILSQRIGAFHLREIREFTSLSNDRVDSAVKTLIRQGKAVRCGKGLIKATTEGLALLASGREVALGPKGPQKAETTGTSLRSRLWKALRLAQKASVSDLLELAARGSESNASLNAKEYLRALEKSGHIMRLSRRAPSEWPVTTGESRYCLVLNTGPQAPQWNKRQKRIFDPNTGETFELA